MINSKKKKRTRKVRTPEQKEARVKTFKMFGRLVLGAVKIWLAGSPYIVLADDVDEFIKAFPNVKAEPAKEPEK